MGPSPHTHLVFICIFEPISEAQLPLLQKLSALLDFNSSTEVSVIFTLAKTNIRWTLSCSNPIPENTLNSKEVQGEVGECIYKIRAIFASVPAFVGKPSQKRCVKGPQRCLEAFQYKAEQSWCGNLGLLWARSPLGSFGGLAQRQPPLH